MGAIRRRFTPAEREVFTAGAKIQWLHVSHWQPAVINTGEIKADEFGQQSMGVTYMGPTTRTISHGAYITGLPKHIRVAPAKPAAPVVDPTSQRHEPILAGDTGKCERCGRYADDFIHPQPGEGGTR